MTLDAAEIKRGEKLFRKESAFAAAAENKARIPPPSLPEVAFAGRSNVGKSSLLNALTFRKNLARASNTPGRTQQINFFDLGGMMFLVDLPGYGYAKASLEKQYFWGQLVDDYLCSRESLLRVFVLVDSRHGLKDVDKETMKMLDRAGAAYTVVLTKADKTKKTELEKIKAEVEAELKKHPAAMPQAFVTSADKKWGLDELRLFIAELVGFKA